MQQFVYKAKDIRKNKVLRGEGNFKDEYEVKQYLANMQLLPLKVEPQNFFNTDYYLSGLVKRKLELEDLAFFCRQFAVLIEAGISVGASLNLLSRECENTLLRKKLQNVYQFIQGGKSLGEALQSSGIFPSSLISMIESGEISGNLEKVLNQLAQYFENQVDIKKKIQKALTYPMIVMGLVIVTFFIIMIEVIPSFVEMFDELEASLPLITQMIITMSDWFANNWEIIVTSSVITIFLLVNFKRTEIGEYYWDLFIFKIPIIGRLKKQLLAARFSESMALLVNAGIPILMALESSKKIIGSKVAEQELEYAIETIRQGYTLQRALQISSIYPGMMLGMIGIGEETGALDKMFVKIGVYFNSEVKNTTDRLTTIIEPLLTLIIAIIIGTIMLAVITPTFTLATELM